MVVKAYDLFSNSSFDELCKPNKENGVGRLPERLPETGINVLIVGAGYSGLLAAMECWRKGHNVLPILERSTSPMLTGDGITIQASAMSVFRHWPDVEEEIEREGYDCLINYRKHTGQLIYGPDPPQWNYPENKKGRIGPHVPFTVSRVKFYTSLLRQVDRLGLKIAWGKKAVSYFEDEYKRQGGVVTQDGSLYTGDVVIAADGLKSASSMLITGDGENERPRPSGTSIYRCAFPIEYAMKDPLVREYWPLKEGDKPIWEFWMGPGIHIVVGIFHDMALYGVTHRDLGEKSTAAENWEPNIKPEEVLSVIDRDAPGVHPVIPALIRTAPHGSVVHWKTMLRDLRRGWTSPAGYIIQIGDCAHTLLTTSGNGATQAMEDAVSVAACLQLAGKSNVALATKISNRLRYERVSCAQKMGFINSQMKHATDWKKIEQDPSEIRTRFPQWIYKHDPETYVYEKYGEAFNHLVNGAAFDNMNYPKGHRFVPWTIDEVKEEIASGKRIDELLDGDWS